MPFRQCSENQELQERIKALEQQPSLSTGQHVSGEYVEELKKKIQSQVTNKGFQVLKWLLLFL